MPPLLVLVILVGVIIFISWYKRAPQKSRKTGLIYAGAALLLLLALTKGQWLMAMLAGGVAAFQRIMTVTQLFDRFNSKGGPSSGNQSSVRTAFLDMSLDHDSGELTGRVVSGQFSGQELAQMNLQQLLQLFAECRQSDAQSANVLESYLDRRFGVSWRDGVDARQSNETFASSQMSRSEAFDILGLSEEASKEQILEAHKRLIQKVHPDRGGSNYLAARINQAKDLLVG